ncbi:MAG: ribosomal-protein-alanine N-acetyltransferase [Chloroflexi bacterium]|nr:MAG: ribosomal-protein-alanine N-acetyltransferase [Chloroflexota bacterium]
MAKSKGHTQSIRKMKAEDISQVSFIESDAFPQLFPPTSFRREFQRKISTILVAVSNSQMVERKEFSPYSKDIRNPLHYRSTNTGSQDGMDFLTGFIFLWDTTVEESHVMSIGTRRSHRRKGIGEFLLYSALLNSIKKGARSLTLEVRVSNVPAISLYKKYGMSTQGLRKSYYADNHEDAKIMTVYDIQSLDYRNSLNDKLVRLKKHLAN